MAFYNSIYANEEPQKLNVAIVRQEEDKMKKLAIEKDKKHQRNLFLIKKFDSNNLFRHYFKDEMSQTQEKSFRMIQNLQSLQTQFIHLSKRTTGSTVKNRN